jgi:uncharacterized protein (TIGR02145 family)/prepilin-type N-terminal cleavage/methylation domain-containing protein
MLVLKNKIKLAFTLMELLIVIFIIGLLITTSVFSIQNYRSKSRDVERVNDISTIQMALEEYYNKNNHYPETLSELSTGTEIYLTEIPSAPVPIDGDCMEGENNYEYQFHSKNFYTISFCLGSDVKDISAGKNFASHHGIGEWLCGFDFVDDRDDESYTTVQIGSQCWMSEDMKYDNGCTTVEWPANTPITNDIGWCGCYNFDQGICDEYGMLYQWSAAMNSSTEQGAQGICPEGWHVPSADEINTLLDFLKLSDNFQHQCGNNVNYIVKALSSTSSLWTTSATVCNTGNDIPSNNSSGFNALGSGYRYNNGIFYGKDAAFGFWSSTHYNPYDRAYYRRISYNASEISCCGDYKVMAYSVRCLKDN